MRTFVVHFGAAPLGLAGAARVFEDDVEGRAVADGGAARGGGGGGGVAAPRWRRQFVLERERKVDGGAAAARLPRRRAGVVVLGQRHRTVAGDPRLRRSVKQSQKCP